MVSKHVYLLGISSCWLNRSKGRQVQGDELRVVVAASLQNIYLGEAAPSFLIPHLSQKLSNGITKRHYPRANPEI